MSEVENMSGGQSSSGYEEEFYIQKVNIARIVEELLLRFARAATWDERADIVDILISVCPPTVYPIIQHVFLELWKEEEKDLLSKKRELEDPAFIISTDEVTYAKTIDEYEEEAIKRFTLTRLRACLVVLEEYNLIPKPFKTEVIEL